MTSLLFCSLNEGIPTKSFTGVRNFRSSKLENSQPTRKRATVAQSARMVGVGRALAGRPQTELLKIWTTPYTPSRPFVGVSLVAFVSRSSTSTTV